MSCHSGPERGIPLPPIPRLGLCCTFRKAKIAFRTLTAMNLKRRISQGIPAVTVVSSLIQHNISALLASVEYCSRHHIGCFRITSELFPLYTHPEFGYRLEQLPKYEKILNDLQQVRSKAQQHNIRLTFHPDQFVILNSPREEVVQSSIAELAYHALAASLVGADVINIHGGGGYGDKRLALQRLSQVISDLPEAIRSRLTIENDDRVFTPTDLLPLCSELRIPFVYDVHHHRCLKDDLSIEEASSMAVKTWDREPLFHISSPKGGWKAKNPRLHADYIQPKDLPTCWLKIQPLTIEVEAKAKELAVKRLLKFLIPL